MLRMSWWAGSLAFALLLSACVTAGDAERISATFISQAEIEGSPAATAFELIQNLRPRWLNERGQETFGLGSQPMIVVYLDGHRMGGPESLIAISARDLGSAERLTVGEATRRWGGNHPRGAIVLNTK
jgi:hypothetical protein